MRALASSGADPTAINRRLQSQVVRLEAEIEHNHTAQEEEQMRQAQKRNITHRLEAELLSLRRELAAARRMEEASVAAMADATNVASAPLDLPVDVERSVSREAVVQQSKQIAWRCQELQALDQKILDAGWQANKKRRVEPAN